LQDFDFVLLSLCQPYSMLPPNSNMMILQIEVLDHSGN